MYIFYIYTYSYITYLSYPFVLIDSVKEVAVSLSPQILGIQLLLLLLQRETMSPFSISFLVQQQQQLLLLHVVMPAPQFQVLRFFFSP